MFPWSNSLVASLQAPYENLTWGLVAHTYNFCHCCTCHQTLATIPVGHASFQTVISANYTVTKTYLKLGRTFFSNSDTLFQLIRTLANADKLPAWWPACLNSALQFCSPMISHKRSSNSSRRRDGNSMVSS